VRRLQVRVHAAQGGTCCPQHVDRAPPLTDWGQSVPPCAPSACYYSTHVGFRFSLKAATPSLDSSDSRACM
jgi:hypothetical protein